MASDTTALPTSRILPVILSGGSGSRLWPISRESFPKQFWPLAGENTMIQETALRAVGPGYAPPMVVCSNDHRFLVAEQLRQGGIEDACIVLEPVGRNSAPAIAVASLLADQEDPDQVLWVMAADSAIKDPKALHDAIEIAAKAARQGRIVTLGMKPTGPETGYGYIEQGAPLADNAGAFDVAHFVEKPNASAAEQMITSGRYYWNAGMFLFTARTMLEELHRHAPDVLATAKEALAGRKEDLTFVRLDEQAFRLCPDISIDYAVAERTDRAAVVPASLGWSDVGSWSALWELGEKDENGNVALGDAVVEHSEHCYVRSDGILTAVAGLRDAVVVVTKDAVLAMHRDRAQDVKKIVEKLKRDRRPEAIAHNRMYRPWGFYESLIQGDRFQVKRILVMPGHKLSLQKHYHRAEHWVVVSGTAIVTRDHEDLMVRENESIYLPLGAVHRLSNPGRIPLTLIEVQSGSYLGEDDIVRLEDTYGRN